jgi:hypothetical protein
MQLLFGVFNVALSLSLNFFFRNHYLFSGAKQKSGQAGQAAFFISPRLPRTLSP